MILSGADVSVKGALADTCRLADFSDRAGFCVVHLQGEIDLLR